MAFYDYLCEANGRTIEVSHPISVRFETWGELCQYAQLDPGDTPSTAAVIRLISAGTSTDFKCKGLDKDNYGDKLRV